MRSTSACKWKNVTSYGLPTLPFLKRVIFIYVPRAEIYARGKARVALCEESRKPITVLNAPMFSNVPCVTFFGSISANAGHEQVHPTSPWLLPLHDPGAGHTSCVISELLDSFVKNMFFVMSGFFAMSRVKRDSDKKASIYQSLAAATGCASYESVYGTMRQKLFSSATLKVLNLSCCSTTDSHSGNCAEFSPES